MLLLKDNHELARYTDDYDFYQDVATKLHYQVHKEYQFFSQVAPKLVHPSIAEPCYFNFNHPLGLVAGFCKRVCHKVDYDPEEMKKFRSFVTSFIHRNYEPLPYIELSHENLDKYWLEGAKYNQARKTKFHEALERFLQGEIDRNFYRCSAFIKKEPYAEVKYPRVINSRSDQFKAVVAPLVHMMEEQVCVNKHTIKHKEKHQFTERMCEIQEEYGQVYETDYSSFEGSFSKEFMMSCEYQLMMYMFARNPRIRNIIKHVYTHPNVCTWWNGCVKLEGSRMSGEMWTSSMNGFSNRMLFEYTCKENGKAQGYPIDYDFIVEGDDGLLAASRALDLSYVTKLGFKLKIQKAESINELSFCGINVCDGCYVPDVTRTLQNITWSLDPASFSSKRRRKEMIHARGLSLMVESSGIPILQEMALKLLTLTEGKFNYHDIDWWYAQNMFDKGDLSMKVSKFISKYRRPITQVMRNFVAHKYKIDIPTQLKFEEQIRQVTLESILENECVLL